jgi:hypothetical protein
VNVVAGGRPLAGQQLFRPTTRPCSYSVRPSVRQKPLTTLTGPNNQKSKPKTIQTLTPLVKIYPSISSQVHRQQPQFVHRTSRAFTYSLPARCTCAADIP